MSQHPLYVTIKFLPHGGSEKSCTTAILPTEEGDGTVDIQTGRGATSNQTSYAHDPDLLVRGRRKRQATSPKATFVAQFVTAPPTTTTHIVFKDVDRSNRV